MTPKQSVPPTSTPDVENQPTVVLKVKDLEDIAATAECVSRQLTDAVLRSVERMAFEAANTTRVCDDCREEYLEDVLRNIASLIEQVEMVDTHYDIRRLLHKAKQQAAAAKPAPVASPEWMERTAGDIIRQSLEAQKEGAAVDPSWTERSAGDMLRQSFETGESK